jgi:hypothetical protein
MVILDREHRYLMSNIEQTDSSTFKFGKWIHYLYDAGCIILVCNINYLRSTYSHHGKPGKDCTGDLLCLSRTLNEDEIRKWKRKICLNK